MQKHGFVIKTVLTLIQNKQEDISFAENNASHENK